MKKGRQKQKANTYERSIAKLFTEAYYSAGGGEFRRIPLSGGWDKRAMPGDLVPLKYVGKDTEEMAIDKAFPMTVECKTWKTIKHFFSGLYSNESQFFDWMTQAWEDALLVKKIPIVVFKLSHMENIAILMSTDFQQLAKMFGNFTGKIYRLGRTREKGSRADGIGTLVFVLLKDFIQWIDWEIYKKEFLE